ncbi:hypothetical protein [Streptomyces sp. NPDC088725]|uniref:hypothetical protein n=1 Tax=Streptomyces sp. NPDC088725 TaxID=3365873 RepID=UPI00382580A5
MTYDEKSERKNLEFDPAGEEAVRPDRAVHDDRTEYRDVTNHDDGPGRTDRAEWPVADGSADDGTAAPERAGTERVGAERVGTERTADRTADTYEPAKPDYAPDATPAKATGARSAGKTSTRKPTAGTATSRTTTRGTGTGQGAGAVGTETGRLIPQHESDELTHRLQEALTTFVDEPRHSVEEAAGVLEEAAKRLSTVLAERPRSLRASWDGNAKTGSGDKAGAKEGTSDTENLRLALQSYREVTERLLRV